VKAITQENVLKFILIKCLVEGCSKGHNTLLHPPQQEAAVEEESKTRNLQTQLKQLAEQSNKM
jgi:hypothetical protein